MRPLKRYTALFTLFASLIIVTVASGQQTISSKDLLQIGKPLPNATLKQYGGKEVRLNELKGKVKIISIVPQLNTPVCDEQTHQFSEKNGGLDQVLDILTLSTNSAEGQFQFAKKANIENLTFLSDAPEYDFGKKTGLLNGDFGYLKRTVIVADENNIIRYVDFVPGGGMPNIKKALASARKVVEEKNPS